MPWEKSFDEDVVIGKAMDVFWEKGFEATSINDLIEGTGVGRGSLYNAFGGKQALFVRALSKYHSENHRAMLAEFESLDDPLAAIHGVFDAILTESLEDKAKKGCFVINTMLELWTHDDETQDVIRQCHQQTTAFFRRCIEVAQARDEIPASVDAATTAKLLMSLIIAIRVLGRGTCDEAELREIAAQVPRLLA